MNKKDATERISKLVELAKENLAQAQKLADEHGIIFHFSPKDSYGMGGTYYPYNQKHKKDWETSDEGWVSSSSQC